jgi:hypothetical protein
LLGVRTPVAVEQFLDDQLWLSRHASARQRFDRAADTDSLAAMHTGAADMISCTFLVMVYLLR